MKTIDGWETKRLDELGTIFSGSTPSTSIASFWNGEIVWITPYDLSRLKTPYISDSSKRITEKGLTGCSAHLLPAGSIVMSSRAPIGYVALPTVPFCTNQGCKAIKLKSVFDSVFAYYNVLFNVDKVKDLGEGTTFAEISKAALSTVELAFPKSLSEQTKVAEILSAVDRAIEQTEGLIAKQQRIKTGLMQDLLTRGIDEHGNIRSEETHEFQDSPLGRIPVEWKAGSILDFASQSRQAILTGPFGAQLGAKDFVEEGVPVLRIGNVQAGYVDQSNLLFVSEQKASGLSRYRVHAGDLLFARQGATTGRNSLASSREDGFLINYHIIRVAIDPKKCSPTFLYATFNSEKVQAQVEREKGKGTREGVNTATLLAFVLPIPQIDEQIRLSDVIDAHRKQTDEFVSQRNKFRALKAALMQALLTGRKRVTSFLEAQAIQ